MTPGERLRKWRKEKNLSSTKVAESIGLSSSMLRMYENGKTAISDKYLIELYYKYGISIDWLLTGNHPGETSDHIPEQYKQIIDLYKDLPQNRQEDLIRIAKTFQPPADQEDPGSESTISQKAR